MSSGSHLLDPPVPLSEHAPRGVRASERAATSAVPTTEVATLYCEPEDHDVPTDDRPFPPPSHEWCLLAEDLIGVRLEETDAWVAHAVTAEYALGHARWSLPVLIVREHEEETPDGPLTFLLLAFRSEADGEPSILFGECAMSADRYRRLRKPFGMSAPLVREASPPFPDEESPAEFDARSWAEFLGDTTDQTP